MRHLAGWIVVRTILVADVALLIVSGFICLVWVAAPGGVLVAAALWMLAGGLLGLLPYTDPYRAEQRQPRHRALASRDQARRRSVGPRRTLGRARRGRRHRLLQDLGHVHHPDGLGGGAFGLPAFGGVVEHDEAIGAGGGDHVGAGAEGLIGAIDVDALCRCAPPTTCGPPRRRSRSRSGGAGASR